MFFSRLPWRPLDRGLVTRGLYSILKEIDIRERDIDATNIRTLPTGTTVLNVSTAWL
ncbi:MAG: hypothetical protein ACTTI3_01385 [Treponema sp.]